MTHVDYSIEHHLNANHDWKALNNNSPHPLHLSAEDSNVFITLRESSNVRILATSLSDIKSFETAIKSTFLFVIDHIITDTENKEEFIQDLMTFTDLQPKKKINIEIENCRNIIVDATDKEFFAAADLALNILSNLINV
ncbi:hypothetical protein [Fictibacillus terranigra]|uniref:Uncharacterized protein n=1 Tax=Fictibacillus terranigra TaxID=3058424 RepID=A0ABT8E703_9BACL|nr:hypothetical protein [Fictibacillus sp. CENA-BCM004]MDN4073659.1 hypothetical protein [Fictibacillus sp. CENA-BCM004]